MRPVHVWTVGGAAVLAWLVATADLTYPIAIGVTTVVIALLVPGKSQRRRRGTSRRLAKPRDRAA